MILAVMLKKGIRIHGLAITGTLMLYPVAWWPLPKTEHCREDHKFHPLICGWLFTCVLFASSSVNNF